jgi:serine/threonine protein kinase
MVADVLHGLRALHQHNIVHRDVRPPNIMEVRLSVEQHACLLQGGLSLLEGVGPTVVGANFSWELLVQTCFDECTRCCLC